MKNLILAAASVTALASASSSAAQTMDHSQHMPGMTMPMPAAKPKPATTKAAAKAPVRKPAKPAARPTPRRSSAPTAAQTDAACPPEHAAMGHCTPRAALAAAPTQPLVPVSPPAAGPPCPPEHAAMGHCRPKPAAQAAEPTAATASDPACPPEHAAMGHCTPKSTAPAAAPASMATGGTALPAGNAPAPAAPEANYADRVWGREAMAPARATLRSEHGGMSFSQLMLNLAEVQFRGGRDGYRWDGEFWYGGDNNRLTIKSEGEGTFREDAEGEVQALYSRAIGPYFNLQAGIRQDLRRGPDRTYATVGLEGLAPYWFDVEGALFLSDKGDVLGRLQAYYDQRVTQRLVLQPRVELNLSAQHVPSSGVGSGVTDAEVGLRLRYEIKREFAPYVGASWERRFGDTARYSRAAGEGTGGFSLVAGIRAWF